MADDVVILVSRDDLDNAIFSAAQELADNIPGLTHRGKVKFALSAADSIMAKVDSITEAGKRSEAAKRAAAVRYSKPKPTPGPAIPPTQVDGQTAGPARQQAPAPGAMPTFTQMPPPPEPLAPPPHPALAPGATPFGAPPA